MEKLQEIISRTKRSTELSVNPHKDYYESIPSYLGDRVEDIGEELLYTMVELDTLIILTAYPHTPIGSHTYYGYDIETVVQQCLDDYNEEGY